MVNVAPDRSQTLIDEESKRLKDSEILHEFSKNDFVSFILSRSDFNIEDLRRLIENSTSIEDLWKSVEEHLDSPIRPFIRDVIGDEQSGVPRDINDARSILGLTKLDWPSKVSKPRVQSSSKSRPKSKR